MLSGPAVGKAWGPETVLGVVMLAVMLAVMLNVVFGMILFGSKGRTCKGHQKQGGGENLFHGINVARLERRR